MKKSHFVASVMSKIDLPVSKLENEIDRLFKFRSKKSEVEDISLPGFENISWHFANLPVSGEVAIVFANRWNNKIVSRNVPAKSGFLATCIQTTDGTRKLAFGASLS